MARNPGLSPPIGGGPSLMEGVPPHSPPAGPHWTLLTCCSALATAVMARACDGWTALVSQKSIDGTHKYRVGIVAAGPEVIYTFLNPKEEYNFSGGQWDTVAVRAGERATQIN